MSGDSLTPTRMVHVRTVPTAFHARVIAARLGAEGFVTEVRGNVGGPYPFGDASVWVTEDGADDASALLLADEVESAFVPAPAGEVPRPTVVAGLSLRQLVASAGLILVVFATLVAHVGL